MSPSNRLWIRLLAGVVLGSLSSGCGGDADPNDATIDLRDDPRSLEPGPRQIREVEWTTVLRVGGTESDTTFYLPTSLEADGSDLYVLDHGRRAIARLDSDGEIAWWFGGPGRGPDEFMHVRDLELDREGRLWVLDVGNARLTVLDRDGEVLTRTPIRDIAGAEQIVPLSGSRAVLVTLTRAKPLVVIDVESGKTIRQLEMPWSEYRKIEPLAAQMRAAGYGDRFVLAFTIGNGFFTFQGTAPLPYYGTFVEHTRFPAVITERDGNSETRRFDRKPVFSAYALDVDSTRIHVLFAGQTDDRYAIVDIYALSSGLYLHSVRLPRRVSTIAVSGNRVYGIYSDPYPAVVGWRRTDRDRAGPSSVDADGGSGS